MVATSASMIKQARRLCHDVYLGMGYIGSPYPFHLIPEDETARNTYLVAIDSANNVVGTIRVSTGSPYKIIDTWNGHLFHQQAQLISTARCNQGFELGALAVRKDQAHLRISWGLYNMAYRWALANHCDYGIISMDQRAFRSLEMLGWFAIQIGEPMYYLGSMTLPAILPILEQPVMAVDKAKPWFHFLQV